MNQHSAEYLEYLRSDKWKERRKSKLETAKFRCEQCGERDGLQVHHLNYARLGHERTDDLIVLCRTHHWVADEMRRGSKELAVKFFGPIGETLPDKFVARCPGCGSDLVKSSKWLDNGSMFCPTCYRTVSLKEYQQVKRR